MKLYETITAENWIKGTYHSVSGGGCAIYHMDQVYAYVEGRRSYYEISKSLIEVIATLYEDRCHLDIPGGVIASFNDHPDTTFEDVIRVCKLADV